MAIKIVGQEPPAKDVYLKLEQAGDGVTVACYDAVGQKLGNLLSIEKSGIDRWSVHHPTIVNNFTTTAQGFVRYKSTDPPC